METIRDDGVAALTRGLKNLTSLKILKLYDNEIGDVGVAILVEETKHLSSLQDLNLWDNKITDKGIAKLTEARKTVWTGLNSLFSHYMTMQCRNAPERARTSISIYSLLVFPLLCPVNLTKTAKL